MKENSQIISGPTPARLRSLTAAMPRQLRPRRTRQSYTTLLQSEDEQEILPGPSLQLPVEQDDDSGSDFAPPAPEEAPITDEDDDDNAEEDPASLGDGIGAEADTSSESASSRRRSKKKSSASRGKPKSTSIDTAKAKGKQKAKANNSLTSPAPAATPNPATHRSAAPAATPATSNRQSYALPNPNVHHRHRPVPLFSGPTATAAPTPASASTTTSTVTLRVERLQRAPQLFAPNETTPTNAYASSAPVTRRVGKAWGAGVGAGPVWQIVEDLGWFKEAEKLKPGTAGEQQASEEAAADEPTPVQIYDERRRRPRVYADIALPEGWAVPFRAECVSTFHS